MRWSSRPALFLSAAAADRPDGVSEAFGTLRFGRLAEILLYDVRRSMTMAGASAVFIERGVETWLTERMAARDVAHVVNMPSNPPGWSAGKWGEWYPDSIGEGRVLSLAKPKPYWQSGWLAQHDRLLAAMSAMPGRIPLVMSGDLHATAEARIFRTGAKSLERNPVVAALSGTLGTGDGGWPSAFRGIGALPSKVLEMAEDLKPIEENGFALMDFTPGEITDWSDAAITADDGRTFPALPIKPVLRSDGSGTSAQFTAFMASQTPDVWNAFCTRVGIG